MALVTFIDQGPVDDQGQPRARRMAAAVLFAEEEWDIVERATKRDRDWLQNLIVEAIRVHGRNFAEEELQQRIAEARAPRGSLGQFGPMGSSRLA